MVDIPAHFLHFAGAETLGNRYGEPVTGTAAESDYHKLDTGGGADRRQCARAEKSPDDDRVNHIVGLLYKLSQQDRNHKTQDETEWTSLCHAADSPGNPCIGI